MVSAGCILVDTSRMTNVANVADGLLEAIGIERRRSIEIDRPPVFFASSFRVEEAAAALVASLHAAIDHLLETLGHAPPDHPTRLRRSLVADAFRSERLCVHTVDAPLWDNWSGHVRSADGFVQYHTNFAHHRRAVADTFGLPIDAPRADLEAATARVTSEEIDRRLTDSGGIVAVMRTLDEWDQHPHAIEEHQLLTVAPPVSSTSTRRWQGPSNPRRPLDGLRVVDCTRIIAGPVASRLLGSLGADVVRIGSPHLPVVDAALPDTTLGKRFAHLDLRDTDDHDCFGELISSADVVIDGYRPGALDGQGFGRHAIRAIAPHIVHVDLSAFGTHGAWAGRRGFDSITQTATGIVDAETAAFRADTPKPLPCQFLDHGAGHLLALGTIAALAAGGGADVTTSLLAVRNWLVSLGRTEPGSIETSSDESNLETRTSPYGPVTHVHPVLATEPGWDVSWDVASLPGADTPEWIS